jgi:hypothetical protein
MIIMVAMVVARVATAVIILMTMIMLAKAMKVVTIIATATATATAAAAAAAAAATTVIKSTANVGVESSWRKGYGGDGVESRGAAVSCEAIAQPLGEATIGAL